MHAYDSGDVLNGRYRLTNRLASGATAVVWRAIDERLGRDVAVKALHTHLADDDDLLSRFADEARVAASVTHPSLVDVYDTVSGPPPAIVLELVDGPDLRRLLDTDTFSTEEVIGLGWHIADALDVAHRAGFVHRDVKPANIICDRTGLPKLGDFGIATAGAGDRTATGLVLGTAKYLAPEQVTGDRIDPRTDVYALSVVLYEALCGKVPFEREGDLPTALARLEGPPPMPRSIRADIPTGLESIVLTGLAREPTARWPTAGALRDALAHEAARLGIDLGPFTIDLSAVAVTAGTGAGSGATPDLADRTDPVESPTADGTDPVESHPDGPVSPHRPRRLLRRLLTAAVFVAVLALGAVLVRDANPLAEAIDGFGSDPDPVAVAVTAFDPEGTGPQGEHDDEAVNVLDGDPSTSWSTERYDDRGMGVKRGVGLIIELAEAATVDRLTVTADRAGWAAEVYLADDPEPTVDGWGPPVVVASGLGRSAELSPRAAGSWVLLWLTDLGPGAAPFRLVIAEVTIA